MTREQRLELLKQIEKDIHVCSLESTLLNDAKSCAIHSAIEELEQEPCGDAISREQAINQCGFGMTNLLIADCLRRLPPVNPQPKTGHWIWQTEDIYRCSECHEDIHVKEVMSVPQYKWCPICGARMVEPQKREDKE